MKPLQLPQEVGRIHRTPAMPPLDGRDLEWLIERYLEDRQTKVVTKTLESYSYRLRTVIEWWLNVAPTQQWMLTAADLGKFEHYLRSKRSANYDKPLSFTYRKGILQCLREVFCWAYQVGYTTIDYSGWVPAAKGVKRQRHAAGEGELLRLLDECDNSPRRVRDRAIIAIFIGMGLRCVEVSNLQIEDIQFAEDLSGYAHVRGKRTKANPTGERDSAFDATTGAMIAEQIADRKRDSGPLFVSYRGKPIKTYTLYGIVKKLIARAGLEDQIQACHDLRRAFATHFTRRNRGPQAADILRRQLGHTSYSQTVVYALLDVEDLRKNIVSPLAKQVSKLAP